MNCNQNEYSMNNPNTPDNIVVELLGQSPFPNTLQTEDVIAIWKYTKSLFADFLRNYLETDAASFIFGSGYCK